MSVKQRMYFCPGIICDNISENWVGDIRSCPNINCSVYALWVGEEISFCPKCGTSISKVQVPAKSDKVDRWKISEKFNEALCSWTSSSMIGLSKNSIVWFPNDIRWGRDEKSFLVHEDAWDEIINPSAIDYEKGLDMFKNLYAEEIKIIQEAYGKENTKIQWVFGNVWC